MVRLSGISITYVLPYLQLFFLLLFLTSFCFCLGNKTNAPAPNGITGSKKLDGNVIESKHSEATNLNNVESAGKKTEDEEKAEEPQSEEPKEEEPQSEEPKEEEPKEESKSDDT